MYIYCTSIDVPSNAFRLLPNTPLTQIHADVISDGTKIWMTYNLPNEDSEFDVFLVSFGCDGSIQEESKQIMNVLGLNQTTPRIAISQDRILVVSQGDSGSSSNNLSIHLYIQDTQGNVIVDGAFKTSFMKDPSIVEILWWVLGTESSKGPGGPAPLP